MIRVATAAMLAAALAGCSHQSAGSTAEEREIAAEQAATERATLNDLRAAEAAARPPRAPAKPAR